MYLEKGVSLTFCLYLIHTDKENEPSWCQVEEQHGNLTVNTTQLLYSAVSCYASASPALLCEVRVYSQTCTVLYCTVLCTVQVRVYTQTWWYWTTTNWLSILFLFTLVLLIISACVTVQVIQQGTKYFCYCLKYFSMF